MTELAAPNEPLVLADGTKIDPSSGAVIQDAPPPALIPVPTNSEAINIVTRTRKSVNDLPDVPKRMNIISVVLSYKMFGLDDEEIAVALGISLDQVVNIQGLDAFKKMREEITESILQRDSDEVRNIFKQHAKRAARKVVTIMEESDGALGLSAAKDLLDRDGHRPADVVEHRHSMEGGLTIHVVKKGGDDLPAIDVTPEAIADASGP